MTTKQEFVLLVGNVLDGVVAVGPFASSASANAWGERHHSETEFYVTALIHPERYERLVNEELAH